MTSKWLTNLTTSSAQFLLRRTDQIPVAENLVGDRDTLEDISITEEKVKEKLRNLKPDSAPGLDKLWPRILQSLSSTLAQPHAMVYTKELRRGNSTTRLEACKCCSCV